MNMEQKIYWDLSKSPYAEEIGDLTYVFSTERHKNKFIKLLSQNRQDINDSVSNRFNIYIDLDQLCDIKLYEKIETYGFLIFNKERGETYTCLPQIRLSGIRQIKQNC